MEYRIFEEEVDELTVKNKEAADIIRKTIGKVLME